jgi:hypothetical protein
MHEHTTIPFPHPQLLTEDPLLTLDRRLHSRAVFLLVRGRRVRYK